MESNILEITDKLTDLNISNICKTEILENWVNKIEKNGLKQGTDEWLQARQYRIGGSSVSVFTGYNPFKSKVDFALDSLKITKFEPNIKPQWGNLFEDVICSYVEMTLGCEALGTNMFYPDEEGIFAYSPDGLALIKNKTTGEEKITLLEFKCPYNRIPNGKVPPYYIPQVLMGLDMIKIAEQGLYIEGVFRRCCYGDLRFNSMRDMTLVDVPKRPYKNPPLAIGVIVFYCESLEILNGPNMENLEFSNALMLTYREFSIKNDLGILPPRLFIALMHLFDKKIVKVMRGKPLTQFFQTAKDDIRSFKTEIEKNGWFPIGVLPWKLFQCDFHYIAKQEGYLDNIRESAIEMITFLNSVKHLTPEQKKSAAYHQFKSSRYYDESESSVKNQLKLAPDEMPEEELSLEREFSKESFPKKDNIPKKEPNQSSKYLTSDEIPEEELL